MSVKMENIHTNILKYVFSFLQDEDVAVARFVCRRWKRFLPHPIYVTCAAYVQYPHVIPYGEILRKSLDGHRSITRWLRSLRR